jgi:hypothetical protein
MDELKQAVKEAIEEQQEENRKTQSWMLTFAGIVFMLTIWIFN